MIWAAVAAGAGGLVVAAIMAKFPKTWLAVMGSKRKDPSQVHSLNELSDPMRRHRRATAVVALSSAGVLAGGLVGDTYSDLGLVILFFLVGAAIVVGTFVR
jgi:hypothetical protein